MAFSAIVILASIFAAGNPSPSARSTSADTLALDAAFTKFDYLDYDRGILWTATVTFRRGDVEVDLVSVVHFADKGYWREIQRELASCDRVFFELVAGKERENNLSSFARLQIEAGRVLNLAFQLLQIDYNLPNFVHADLSWAEILKLLEGGRLPPPPQNPILKKVVPSLSGPHDLQLEDPFADNPSGRAALKVFLGQILGDVQHALQAFNIEHARDSILIGKRNTRAMDVVRPNLHGKTRLAIFYGAAHMPDFARRLRELGFKPVYVRWHMAWRIGRVPLQRWF